MRNVRNKEETNYVLKRKAKVVVKLVYVTIEIPSYIEVSQIYVNGTNKAYTLIVPVKEIDMKTEDET